MDLLRRRMGPRILIIEAPPRHGKSEFISRYLPAWYLGTNPENRVILTSYSSDYARNWGRKAKSLLDEFGPEWFGVTPSKETRASTDWELAVSGGGMLSTGIGGPLTGRGANLFIVDDPVKSDVEALSERIREHHWDWWQATASTRLEPGGVAIIMATRWHRDDLSGKLLLAAETGEGEPVMRLSLPAIAEDNDLMGREPGQALWPERWPLAVLERKKHNSDPYWWNALYQQRPSKHGRTEWPAKCFAEHIWINELNDSYELSAIAIDPSKGLDQRRGDYAAIAFAGLTGGKIHVHVWMAREPVSTIVDTAISLYQMHQPDVLGLEANAWQDLIAPEFDRRCEELRIPPVPVHLITNTIRKEIRIGRLGPYLHRNQFRFTRASGLSVRQLEEFPQADHDDGPDAIEMAVRLLGELATLEQQGGPDAEHLEYIGAD